MKWLPVLLTSCALLGPAPTVGAAAPTGVTLDVPALADDDVVPPEQLLRFVDDTRDFLDQVELELRRGFPVEPTAADQDRIDELHDWLDELEDDAGAATWSELDDLDSSLFDFVDELFVRGGIDPYADPLDPPTVVAAPVGSVPAGSGPAEPVSATTTPAIVTADGPEVVAAALRAAAMLVEEARLLDALGAFDDDTSDLTALLRALDAPPDDRRPRADLIADLVSIDDRAAADLGVLTALTPAIGPFVRTSVDRLPTDTIELLRSNGDTIALTAAGYVEAIEALAVRSGRPAVDGAVTATPEQLATRLEAEYRSLVGSTTAADAAATTVALDDAPTDGTDVGATATTPAEEAVGDDSAPGSAGVPLLAVAVGAVLLVAAAVLAWLLGRRRRPPVVDTPRRGFHDLLDVSRRLAPATTTAEVEQIAVRQAMHLTGAVAGAFVRHDARVLSVGWVSDEGLLVAERLGDGVLDRVVGAGQEMMQVSQTEPAIRSLPVSLIAAPVFATGSIVGAILLLRDADRPFDAGDLAVLSDLKPIVGSAFESTQHAERAQTEALTDGLTGVSNRRALDLAVAARGDEASFAVIMVDLDHFKSVNDTYGHQGGDDMLRSVAQRITTQLRPGDHLYRYGGEEFAVVLPDTDQPTAAAVAERIRSTIAATPFTVGPDAIRHRATASLGVAAGSGGTGVFSRADAALYEAKESGRDRVVAAGVPA